MAPKWQAMEALGIKLDDSRASKIKKSLTRHPSHAISKAKTPGNNAVKIKVHPLLRLWDRVSLGDMARRTRGFIEDIVTVVGCIWWGIH
jgi:hypothetical protein